MADTSKLPISRVDELIDKLNEINNNFNIINNKLDSMKYVIESGSNENNTQWYRKWNDGWIEQGGIYNYGSFIKDLGGANINFLINFSNVNYQIFATSFRTDRDNEGNGTLERSKKDSYTKRNAQRSFYSPLTASFLISCHLFKVPYTISVLTKQNTDMF